MAIPQPSPISRSPTSTTSASLTPGMTVVMSLRKTDRVQATLVCTPSRMSLKSEFGNKPRWTPLWGAVGKVTFFSSVAVVYYRIRWDSPRQSGPDRGANVPLVEAQNTEDGGHLQSSHSLAFPDGFAVLVAEVSSPAVGLTELPSALAATLEAGVSECPSFFSGSM